ncbi:CD249 [Mytilus edulis]|uniref:ENPEP n=1 Tax=Mytilus edulis TaxID=6550 RepID=A0A8S3TV14_MYTED|nr:CD249 [Mytilus edulis]
MFCKSCIYLVCPLCISETHNGHGLVTIREGYEILIGKLKTRGKIMGTNINELEKRKEEVKDVDRTELSNFENTMKKIKDQNVRLKKEVDQYTKKLETELIKKWKDVHQCTETEEKEVSLLIESLASKKLEVDDIIQSNDGKRVFEDGLGLVQTIEEKITPPGTKFDSIPIFLPGQITPYNIGSLENISTKGDIKIIKQFDTEISDGEQFICKALQRALSRDSQKTSHPIQVPVHNPDDINEIFDTISYDKGASVIRMLREFLGKEKFMDGITSYLQQYKYGNAVTVDLWSALSKKSGNTVDVKAVMDTWTLQMGYPVVSVKKSGNKFILTQERFLSDGSATTNLDESPFGYKWHIPFRYTVLYKDGSNSTGMVWLHKGSGELYDNVKQSSTKLITLQLEGTNSTGMVWLHKGSAEISVTKDVTLIKGNYGMYGFYRVNYEEVMWNTIIQQLQTNHTVFSPGDRSGLIDDVFNLARAGLVKHTTALDMTKYLKKEEDYAPWYSALGGLGFIRKMLQKSPAYEQFKTYTLNLVKPIQTSLTWNDSGEPLQKYLRSNLLSEVIMLGDSDATKKGRQLYDDWMIKNTSIPPNLKTAVYTAGIKYGEWSEWKYMLKKYNTSITPSNKDRYLSTLGETRDSIVINRLLHMALNEDMIKHQDLYKVMRAVTKNPSGQLLAWRFVQQNWEKLLQWYGDVSFTLPEFVKSTTSSFSTEFDYKEVEEFFKKVDSGPAKRAVSTALENIRTNINWLKSHEDEVKTWLQKNV